MSVHTLVLPVILLTVSGALAQPTSAPASAPARHVLVVPPGFKMLTVGHHSAVVEPADEGWVTKTLTDLSPTTLPTTMPADLLEKLAGSREALKARMVKDLALTDGGAGVDKFFKETLEPQLNRYDSLAPPLFYMVTTRARLLEMVKGGWSDPRFYYNRVADDVQMSGAVSLDSEGPGDDVLVPIIHEPDEPTDRRAKRLTDGIHQIELQLAGKLSAHAQINTQVAFIGFISSQVLEPLKVKPDQEWFSVGFAGMLSARYTAALNGMDPAALVAELSSNPAGNPIRPDTIDLLHPTPLTDMRPQAVPYYADSFRRKSTRVVSGWVAKAGEDALPKMITAMRAGMPADGAGLVKLIQQTSGVDLTNEVKAR